jgi:hypothetical protein
MSESGSPRFRITRSLLFRTCCIYLILYFLFISDFLDIYRVLWHVNRPLEYISRSLGLLLNKIFFNPAFKEIRFYDSYWTYSKLLTFFILAIVMASIWTFTDKGQRSRKLFICMHAFARYYLFVGMFIYGIYKIFGNQLIISPHLFFQSMDFYRPQLVIWTAMAASKAYPLFGGIMEVLAAILLLFRRTATLGALIALSLLINVLVLDIGFDTPVKVIVFHLLFFNLIILWPDIKKLYQFLILKKPETLSMVPPVVEQGKFQKPAYILKALFIGMIIIPRTVANININDHTKHTPYKNLMGIHEMDTSSGILSGVSMKTILPKRWKNFSIERDNQFYTLLPDGTVSAYHLEADTVKKTLLFISSDSLIRGNLTYRQIDSVRWFFEGTENEDSLRFITRQIDIFKHPLLKDYGRIIWSWSPSTLPD